MKTKMWLRILSTILSILFVLEILPISVMAEEYNEYKDLSNAELSTQQEEKSPIVSEVVSERDAFKKVFEREDGSFTAIISSGPVHYFEDGEWLEIDNTLTETNGTITNESNSFSVDLPSEITSDKNVTIATENAELSFTMENISSSAAEITDVEPVDDETSLMMGLDNIASSVEYTSVMTNTDLVYDISADSVKESIILSSCPSQATDYSYTINSNGATLYLNEDNSINVVNNGQIEFVIEAPYMFDSNGISTDDIDVSLENTNDSTYILTYSPDYGWLSSEERVYPVTIDPTTTVYSATTISEAFIGAVDESATDLDKFHYLKNANRLYFKYSDSVSNGFGNNAVITNAEFSLYCEALTNDDTIAVFPIIGEWEEGQTSPVSENSQVLDYNKIKYGEAAKRYVWDITEVAAKWQMNQLNNNGISLKTLFDSSVNTKIYRSTTAHFTTHRPWFQIDYVTIDNMAEYDTETVDMGRAGTLYLNKYTGTYYVKRTDLSLNGNISPVEMGFTYDPWSESVAINSSYGAYWITDYYNKIFYSQTVTENNVTRHQYTFRDNGGVKTRFVEVVATDEDYNTVPEGFTESYLTNYTRYKAVSGDLGKCLWVPKSDTTYKDFANMIIEDSVYRYTIDSINRITSRVHKTSGAVIAIEHRTASSDAIRSVTDGVGRKYDLPSAYNTNGKVITDKLVVYNSLGNEIKVSTLTGNVAIGVDYGYTALDSSTSLLTTVTYADGESITYEYNSDGLMTAITNVDGSRLELRYSGDRVIGYTKYAYYVSANSLRNCFESQLDISFDGPKQRTFTYYEYDDTAPSIVVKQRYNSALQATDYVNTDGDYSYTKTTTSGTTETTSYSLNDDEATNLITNGDFSSGKTGWTFTPNSTSNYAVGTSTATEIFDEISQGFCTLKSGMNTNLRASQTIASLPANEDTVYTLSAWVKTRLGFGTSYVNNYAHANKTLAVCITNSSNEILAQYDFDTTTDEWQFGAVSFKTDVALENVKVIIMADGQHYPLRFSSIKLVASKNGSVEVKENGTETNTPSDDNDLIEELPATVTVGGITYKTSPCEECSCVQCTETKTVTYNGEEIEVYYSCDCGKTDVTCNCLGCRQERGTVETKDSYGNVTSETLSNGTDTLLLSESDFSDDGNYLEWYTGSDGVQEYYIYDVNTGMVYVHNNKMASLAFISYTYNAVGALQAVRRNPLVDPSAIYTYDRDRVTSISHGETVYSYEYDGYGNCTEIKVGTQPLRTTSYNQNQTINTITYGNGDTVSYTYDDDKNISTISFDGGTTIAYRYEYEDGELTKIYDYVNLLVSRYTKSDDGSSSAFQINKFTQSGSTITEGEQIYSTTYSSENNTTTVNVFGKTYTYETLDDSYNSLEDTVTSCVKATVNGKTLEHSTTTDFFDRKVSEKASLSSNSASLNTTYSYKEKNNYETTQLNGINVTLGDRTLFNEVYTYDDSGNITLIENSSGTDLYKYTYDIQQQITAEYNFVLGTATTYTYDDFGNILTKTPYTNVTSDDLSTATVGETKSYTYDTTWTDKLTSFGGESIVYDEIGNPTTYRGATLTWDGRQLMSYSKDGTNISYQYNADGLRTKQLKYDSQGRISIEITYLWDNGQLVGYTSTLYDYSAENGTISNSFDIKIHYDEASEPYAVTVEEKTYYYIRNAVGDVKGLISADTGEYIYALDTSAYGVLNFIEPDLTFDTSGLIPDQLIELIKKMEKLALQLCLCIPTANTYKGYSYDVFTGLYYLQSRYYDPEVGRFINADDVDYLGASGKPISYNLFAYCENNPVNNSDPTGYIAYNILGAVIGCILGLVGGVFLAKWLASKIRFKNNTYKKIFIAGVTLLVGASATTIGYFCGPYIAKAWNYIRASLMGLRNNLFRSIGKISAQKMNKIKANKHLWDKVLGKNATPTNIQNLILKAIKNGEWRVQSDGVFRIVYKYGKEYIVVTGNIVNKVFMIGNSWVWNGVGKIWGSAE